MRGEKKKEKQIMLEGEIKRCDCAKRRKEGNALFNDALNTFILRLFVVGHI